MRTTYLLGAIGAFVASFTAAIPDSQVILAAASIAATSTSSSAVPFPPSNTDGNGVGSAPASLTPQAVNATAPSITATVSSTSPNTTNSQPTEVTGGAIPQQMQASMAGLLGFCIMGLVML